MNETIQDNLKLCPFCGGRAEVRMDTDISGGGLYVYVVCRLCGAHRAPEWTRPDMQGRKAAVIKATRDWNRRVRNGTCSTCEQ